jgi:hypothetical protein
MILLTKGRPGYHPLVPFLRLAIVLLCLLCVGGAWQSGPVELKLSGQMEVDVDGAPNAYGPPGKHALDDDKNARNRENKIVGYLTENNDGRTPVIQGQKDPLTCSRKTLPIITRDF